MLWNMINKPDDLWCKVIYSQYGRNNDLQVAITSQPYDSPPMESLSWYLGPISKTYNLAGGRWSMNKMLAR